MPVDSRLVSYLADPRNTVRRPPDHIPIEKVRKAANAAMTGMEGPAMHDVTDMTIDADGPAIPVRLYRPTAETLLPLIVFVHGGGWVWGDLATHDPICRQLASAAGAAVLAVDYRLAPEASAPDQVDDVLVSLLWALNSARELGLDGSRVALCGDSAGGALALATALRARASGIDLSHLALIYPALDSRCDTASQQEFAEGYMLTRDAMRWFWEMHLGSVSTRRGYVPAAELAPPALAGLPSVSLSVAEFDVLRDEGIAFAHRLREAGVPVRLRAHDGMVHGFLSLAPTAEVASTTLAEIGADIAQSFEQAAERPDAMAGRHDQNR